MNKTSIPYIRQLSQQLATPQFSSAYDIVDWMGMIQAQDYASMPWAVGARMKQPSMEKFIEDFNNTKIVRTHIFRNTIQLVTADDLPWMQMLYADKGLKTELTFSLLHGLEDERSIALISEKTSDILSQRNHINKENLIGILQEQYGITIDKSIAHRVLRVLEYKGVLCSGPMDGRFPTWSLLSNKVPTQCHLSREEAMVLLARKYFRSHSPACLEDFVWWCSLSKKECASAISSIVNEMEEMRVDGQTFYIHQSARIGSSRQCGTQLLPAYDEYLIGYKSRHFVLNPKHTHKAYNNFGIFWPVILYKGQIIGNWNRNLEVSWFEESMQTNLIQVFDNYKRFQNQEKFP